jgi:phytoene dehydrogenase-like protein
VGDAAGEIDVGDGTWTAELADAYADRIVDRVAEHFPTLREQIVGRAFISPRDIERRNPNLVRGDIYSGDSDLAQSYLWRPLPSYGSHASPIEHLFHCGASTFPGPGLSGTSGRIVAQALLGRRSARRLRRP